MLLLLHIDWYLMNRAQRLSDWFQELTGHTNFALARICVYAFVALFLSSVLAVALQYGDNPLISLLLLFPLGLFVAVKEMGIINKAEKEYFDQNNQGGTMFQNSRQRNPAKRFTSLVMFFAWPLILSPLIDMNPLLTLAFMSLQPIEYFLSCTPKPLKKSKLQKSIEKWKEKLTPQTPELALSRRALQSARMILIRALLSFF